MHIDLDGAIKTGNGEIKIPVSYESTRTPVPALDYTLYYNNDLINVLRVEKSDYGVDIRIGLSHNVRENDVLVTSYAAGNQLMEDTIVHYIVIEEIDHLTPADFGNGRGYIRGIRKELRITGEISNVTSVFEEENKLMPIHVYPNPFSNRFEVTIPNSTELSSIMVSDTRGNILFEEPLIDNNQKLSFLSETWPRGLYFLTCRNSNGAIIHTEKLTK